MYNYDWFNIIFTPKRNDEGECLNDDVYDDVSSYFPAQYFSRPDWDVIIINKTLEGNWEQSEMLKTPP